MRSISMISSSGNGIEMRSGGIPSPASKAINADSQNFKVFHLEQETLKQHAATVRASIARLPAAVHAAHDKGRGILLSLLKDFFVTFIPGMKRSKLMKSIPPCSNTHFIEGHFLCFKKKPQTFGLKLPI